jgi:hypothetical protein
MNFLIEKLNLLNFVNKFYYICNMKGELKNIGKFTKLDSIKLDRKISREMELENSNGWVCQHKVHKSIKNYSRKTKHKLCYV